MAITIHCSACGRAIPVAPADAGKRGTCPGCGRSITAPPIGAPGARIDLAPTSTGDDAPTRPVALPSPAPRAAATSDRASALPQEAELASEVQRALADPARRFGPFVLLSELGKGGMGVVYRAWNARLRRVVALKTILPGEGVDAAAVARFRREAEAAARLRHPNIVSVHEAGEVEGRQFIAMDFVSGRSLDARLRPGEGKIAFHRALEVVRDVARAVHYAHSQGVVHRDLKPQNVIVDASDRPFVLDFGLAAIRGAGTRLTKTGASMGTPAYMPPEQASGESVDERADVYSLGAILYQALTGRPPFSGESDVNMIVAVLTKDPAPPSKLNARAAGDLDTICLKCLEKERERRYASAEDLALELDRYLRGDPIEARPIGSLSRLWRRARRRKAASAGAALAILGLALGAHGLLSAARAQRAGEDRARVGQETDALLARARAGRLAPAEREEAIFAILRSPDAETVAKLGRELDAIASDLERATRSLYEEGAREPGGPIEGIETALAAWRPGEKARGPLLEAQKRILAREEARARTVSGQAAPTFRDIAATAQGKVLGGRVVLEAVASDALGRIGIAEGALEPLARVLGAESDPGRAVSPASAICRLGRSPEAAARAYEVVWSARDRFGQESGFWHQVKPAFKQIAALSEREPGTAVGFRERAQRRNDRGELDAAIADYGRAIELDPRYAMSFNNRGAALLEKGELARAIADFDRAIELDPRSSLAFTNRGVARSKKGERDDALADLTHAIELDPLPGHYNNRANLLCEKRDFAGAIADYTRAIELDPRDARSYINRANALQKGGDLEKALGDYERAIDLDPRSSFAFMNRGFARHTSGDLDGALADYTHALELDPRNALAFLDRGKARIDKGDLDGAISDYTRALELDPRNLAASANRGKARATKGDLAGALADYDRAVEIDPASATVRYDRGRLLQARGDAEGAIADYTRAIQLDPHAAPAFSQRGSVRFLKGDVAGALADYDRAVGLAPESPYMHSNRANARGEAGDLKGAIADFTRALELDPRCLEALAGRGKARRRAGDPDGARADLSRFLELAPSDPRASFVREDLRLLPER
ncbi:tetratricopeptide repeat protein [bacterium]|nr:tetratricopeptide repeat protein [bacterium]